MKKSLIIMLILILACTFVLSSCLGDLDFSFLDEIRGDEDTTETAKPSKKPSHRDEEEEEDEEDEVLTSTEIYNRSVKYVGEIITYDARGNQLALGTGFVISADGEVLTNYHVIDGAFSADITINDETYAVSTVLAYDEYIDLAVLKIDASNLPHATLCERPVETGEHVYAIGSPRGLTNTYSQGIVTHSNRIIDGVCYVQHDASITHGNSGGPLINAYGEVIGVNTWGVADSQNLNFAVYIGELDNLVYRTPFTLEEFYYENFSPFLSLAELIVERGELLEDGSELLITGDRDETVTFGYTPEDETVSMIYFLESSNGITFYMGIILEQDTDEYYYAARRLLYGQEINKISGYIESESFTQNTLVGYNDYTGSSEQEELIREAASDVAIYLVEVLDTVANDYLDLDVSDFGFLSFS